jgi:SAM-dependent methyltransferase
VTQDLYAGFADRYDLFFPQLGLHDQDLAEFFRQLLAQNRARSVLDCACGTGRHLALLHSLGFEVVGSDISPSMLACARENLRKAEINIPLHQADYRELPSHFQHPFDAVVCLSSSILHMPNDDQVVRAFRSIRSVLRDGGLLILTQGTSDRQWNEKPRFILATHRVAFSRLIVIDYHGRGARYNVVDIREDSASGPLEAWSVDYPQVLLRDDLERLLKHADFQPIDFFGSYRFDPYDKKSSDRLIATAHKPPATQFAP